MVQTYYISAKHVQGHILFRALPHPEHRTRLYRRQTLIRTIAQRQDEHCAYNRLHHILHLFIWMSTDPHNILATTNHPFAPWAISSSRLRDPLRSERPHHRTCDSHFAPWVNPISHLQDHSHFAEIQTISLCDLSMYSRPNNNTCDNLVATPQHWFSHFCSWHIVTSKFVNSPWFCRRDDISRNHTRLRKSKWKQLFPANQELLSRTTESTFEENRRMMTFISFAPSAIIT